LHAPVNGQPTDEHDRDIQAWQPLRLGGQQHVVDHPMRRNRIVAKDQCFVGTSGHENAAEITTVELASPVL